MSNPWQSSPVVQKQSKFDNAPKNEIEVVGDCVALVGADVSVKVIEGFDVGRVDSSIKVFDVGR